MLKHTESNDQQQQTAERRRWPRLELKMPVAFNISGNVPLNCISTSAELRGISDNVSTGGIYFHTNTQINQDSILDIAMTIPPGAGHYPYKTTLSAKARIIRIDTPDESRPQHFGLAAEFTGPPNLDL